jgi:mono/diheme cytochrome c family protein
MSRRFGLGFGLMFLLALAIAQVGGIGLTQEKSTERKFTSAAESKAEFERIAAPFVKKHCATCHNQKVSEGDLDFGDLDLDMKASTSAGRWAMVIEKLATREMPPEGRAKPGDDDIKAVVAWIQAEMKRSGKNFARRQAIANGNKIAHEKLFDAKHPIPLTTRRGFAR